nr:DUF6177 family protein [Streptomyces tailanensis]
MSGVPLTWQQGTFTPTSTTVASVFTQWTDPSPERQLAITFRTVHAPDADLILGRGLEAAPRDRARAPTQLIAVGSPDHPAIATLRAARTTAGVAQDVTLNTALAEALTWHREYWTDKDARARGKAYGGQDWDVRWSRTSEFEGVWSVDLTGTARAEDRPVRLTETITWEDEHWVVAPLPGVVPKPSNAADTEPPG